MFTFGLSEVIGRVLVRVILKRNRAISRNNFIAY